MNREVIKWKLYLIDLLIKEVEELIILAKNISVR